MALLIAGLLAAFAYFAVRGQRRSHAPHVGSTVALPAGAGGAATHAAPTARAPGCGTKTASPSGDALTTRGGRTFHVWGPASYDESRPYPVVLTFHGWGSNGRDFAKWFKMEEHVEGAAFTVYPDSRGANWDFAGTKDLDFTAELLEMLADAFCIDRARVLAFGFSYGGRLVHHLGCKRPDLVRAIAAGGSSWDRESGCAPLTVLVTHRTRDETMVIAGGKESAARWAKIDGCSATTEDTDTAHECFGYRGCAAGSVTFCEDTHDDPKWPRSWNHTVREEYRALVWRWFTELR